MRILQYVLPIKTHAIDNGLSPSLVAAICMRESGGDPFAARFEPKWRYFLEVSQNAKNCFISTETEQTLQAFSYGLMQVMGSVAREHGFTGPLPRLYDPQTNLEYGCRHLKKFMSFYKNDRDAIASYNAGWPRHREDGSYWNQDYVEDVLRLRMELGMLD